MFVASLYEKNGPSAPTASSFCKGRCSGKWIVLYMFASWRSLDDSAGAKIRERKCL